MEEFDVLEEIKGLTKQELPATPTTPEIKTESSTGEVPKVETPVAEVKTETHTTEPVVETPKEPQYDLTKIFSENSNGRVSSKDDLTKILQEYDEFKDRLSKSPELDDYTLKLNSWMKGGHDPKLFHAIHDLPLGEMSSEEKVKASLKLGNPDWTEQDIDLFVKNKYGIASEGDDGYDEQKSRYGKLILDQDAKNADKELKDLQNLTIYSDRDEQEVAKLEGNRQEAWKSNLPKMSNDFDKLSFSLDNEGKQIFNYVPTPAQKQTVISQVQKAILNAPVAYDENGIKAVNDLFRTEFIKQNINDIIRSAAKQMASITTEQHIKRVTNPSGTTQQPQEVVPEVKPEGGEHKIAAFMEL